MLGASEDNPLLRLSVIAAMLAAIMLVIGGTPARASAEPCNPCPPDCSMMKAQADVDPPQQAPAKAPADSPCKAMAVCAVGGRDPGGTDFGYVRPEDGAPAAAQRAVRAVAAT